MNFEYTLSPEEFLEGQRVFCDSLTRGWTRLNYKAMIPVGVLLLAEGAAAIAWKWDKTAQILLPALGAYQLLNRFILWPRKIRREYKQYPDHFASRSVEFDENGVVAKTSHGRGDMVWARFSKFVETDRVFVLLAPSRFLYTLPKRVIPPETMDEFRNLLSRKLAGRQT
jgi:YcxB-like protein